MPEKVYVGGPRDGETVACRPEPRWPLFVAGIYRAGGRHTYELDVVDSTTDRAVYRYVGHLSNDEVRRARP